MSQDLTPTERSKFFAAKHACTYVKSGMTVGLGTGTTAEWVIRCIGDLVRRGELQIRAVPTSSRTAALATELEIPVVTLDEATWLDVVIDGADEVDKDLNLIKGGGGALLQEKIVATASDQMIVIADSSKQVAKLGAFPLPVEVVPFGWRTTRTLIGELLNSVQTSTTKISLRMNNDAPFVTDEGHHILDLHMGVIDQPTQLAVNLNQIPGVVEHGLFIDICDVLIIGHSDGRVLERDQSKAQTNAHMLMLEQPKNIFSSL